MNGSSYYQQIVNNLDNLVKSRFIEMFGDVYKGTGKWEKKSFCDIVQFNPKKSELPKDDFEVSFVPMECVGTDNLMQPQCNKMKSDVLKGYTYFRNNDVVIAKITPCFENGKIAIAHDLTNEIGFGTTEFHVARPLPGITNAIWILNLLLLDSLKHNANMCMSGSAGQKRIQTPYFEKLIVEVPPIELQDQFADFVKQVDKSKVIAQKAAEKYDQLVKSRFIEMFEDCEKVPLTQIANVTMGQSPDSTSYNDEGKGVPFYQGKTEFGDKYVAIKSHCTDPKKMAKTNDILMSVRAPVGSVNITLDDCCIGRGLAAISPIKGKSSTDFLFESLRAIEKEIADMGTGSTFKAINKEHMSKIMIPLADYNLQEEFVKFVQQVDKSKVIAQKAAEKYDQLVKSRFIEMFDGNQFENKALSELFKTSSGGTPLKSKKEYYENGTIPWLTSGEVDTLHISKAKTCITEKALIETNTKIPPLNSVLVSMYGSIGYAGILEFRAAINQAICAIHPNPSFTPEWLCYYIRSKKEELVLQGEGVALTNISQDKIRKMKVPCPPLESQNKFTDFVKQVDKSKFVIGIIALIVSTFLPT
jgi:type I restriction enzyme S subunit